MKIRTVLLAILALAASVVFICPHARASEPAEKSPGLGEQEAAALGMEAYIYGYPLVTMEMTRRLTVGVGIASMGQFIRARSYPAPFNHAVTAPNADTLYTMAWLDVSKEPWVLSIPDMSDRYYLVPLLSGWTDVFRTPGTRTTGTKPQKYAITGPDWTGTLPEGVTEYRSPTAMVWVMGRIYSTGTPEDFDAVHALQDKFELVPLSGYGKSYTPPPAAFDPGIDMRTSMRDQVNRMDAEGFFKLLAALMKDNPPAKEDGPVVEKMARIGLVPGRDFNMDRLDPPVARALQAVPKAAQALIMAEFANLGKTVNGWTYSTKLGFYGTDYLRRALTTAILLGANLPLDAIYPISRVDADGQPYDGANKYVMHIDKGEMPPVKAFWSLTMYDGDYFFVPNKLNRYTLSQRNELKRNSDGSVDLYIQKDSPGEEKESNWLPAPAGKFILMQRLYWPKETAPSIIDGTWNPPAVKKMQ